MINQEGKKKKRGKKKEKRQEARRSFWYALCCVRKLRRDNKAKQSIFHGCVSMGKSRRTLGKFWQGRQSGGEVRVSLSSTVLDGN